ncbi:CUB and sushi domain-containing protein 1-like [Haliotis rubra]|uniref:CUB and sushi domain-containing protein 1-like n=1 Tax=Haliotis rubra TaxID=36100 RepID=UPI001EE58828|nr:CUB and sushi domain-containing protein 1-like [Haliotis rubra]
MADMKCAVNCGDPPAINRTNVSPTDGFVNETVEYTCKPGYAHVSGSPVITCPDTGTWEEPGIYCEVNCGKPPSINRGEVSPTDGFVNETVEYTCKPGYAHVSGSPVITCLDTGTWEEPGIYCEVDCSSPPVVANTVVITDNTTRNSIAVYRCTPGFVHASGSTNITCLGTGFWETPFMQCVDTPLPSTMASPTTPDAPVNKFGRTIYEKCTCRCINKQRVDQEDMVKKITKELILDIKSLKSYTRTKESLPDGRKSSQGVGYIAMSVIGVLFGVVFLSDIYYLINVIVGCFSARQ